MAPEQTPRGQCARRRQAWVLDGQLPPTLAEHDAPLQWPLRSQVRVDLDSGQRLSAQCSGAHPRSAQRELHHWPARLQPWLGQAERQASELPPLAADCQDDGRRQAALLSIEGLHNGAVIAPAPGAVHRPGLRLRALAGNSEVDWLRDGQWLARTPSGSSFLFDPGPPGAHTLTALATDGNWQRLDYRVLE